MRRPQLLVAAGLVGAILLLGTSALAQSAESSSGELWTDVGVRWKMSSKASATFTQQLRFDERASRRCLVAPELALRYKLLDWWHLEAGYRYEYERDNDAVFQERHRVFANTRFIARYEPATLELRIQWQEKFRHERDDGTPTRHILRMRAKAKLRQVSAMKPYASAEMFQRLDGLDKDVSAGTIQKLRFGFGLEWRRGPIEFDTRYYLVVPKDDPEDPTTHVLGLGLRFDL